VVFSQYGTAPSQLADIVQALLADPAQLARMGTAMQGLGRPNATREIVAELRAVVDRRRPRAARAKKRKSRMTA